MPSAWPSVTIDWMIAAVSPDAPERSDERAVDLDPVEWKLLQIVQARIAGAEIVKREADAKRAQRFEARLRLLRIIDQYAFGHFQHHPRRSDTGFGHDVADKIDQPAIADLQWRKIDGDGETRPARPVG